MNPEPKKETAKKEDKRKHICLENLRKGREKLMKLRAKGFSTRIPIKGKVKKTPEYKKRGFKLESDTESDTLSDTESESESTESESESEEEYVIKKTHAEQKKPVKQKGRGKTSKLKNELKEMKSLINQLNQSKLSEQQNSKKSEKVVINMLNPSQSAPTKATSHDDLLKRAMFGNL